MNAAQRPHLVVPETARDSDRQAIVEALVAYNDAASGRPSGFTPASILFKHPSTDATIGGLWGKVTYDWLFIELLVVPQGWRGQGLGTQLLGAAEHLARSRNCRGIWLDTFAFQAPEFYLKSGFVECGRIDDHPRGAWRMFFKKDLA